MKFGIVLFSLLMSSFVFAAPSVKGKAVEYKDTAGTVLEGFLIEPKAVGKKKHPVVIVVHDWMGIGDYSKMRAQQMADRGYVAFAADIYGKGVHPKDSKEAGKLAGQYKANPDLLRQRAKAAYDYVAKLENVDPNKVVVMGYCFGGTTALEMARSGLQLAGAVSFHGGLSTAKPEDSKNIKTKLLVLHGAIDPYVPAKEVADFQKEMNDAKVDYQFIAYSGAVHAFTQAHVGGDVSSGAAYNESADKRSFASLLNFLNEVAPTK